MKTSPLLLEQAFLDKIILESFQGDTSVAMADELSVHATPSFSRSDDDKSRWKVGLEIAFKGGGDKPSFYEGKISTTGLFRITATDLPEERQLLILSVNAPSILYGMVREMVAGLTARGIHQLLLLPSVSFADHRIEPDLADKTEAVGTPETAEVGK